MKKEVLLKFAKSQHQIVNIFTKPLKFEDFRRLRSHKSSLRGHVEKLNLI